jgi:hypothetical protein
MVSSSEFADLWPRVVGTSVVDKDQLPVEVASGEGVADRVAQSL